MIVDFNTHTGEIPRLSGSSFSFEALDTLLNQNKVDGAVITSLPNFKLDFQGIENSSKQYRVILSITSFDQILLEYEKVKANIPAPVIGVKIHPRLSKREILQSHYDQTFKFASKEDCLVAVCTYPALGPGLSNPFSTLTKVSNSLAKFPEVKTVLMHAGLDQILSASEIARRFPRCYLDLSLFLSRMQETSAIQDLRWLCKTLDSRLLYGSDTPDQQMDVALKVISDVTAGISTEKRNNIMFQNAIELGSFDL
jgi:hypothetical protein